MAIPMASMGVMVALLAQLAGFGGVLFFLPFIAPVHAVHLILWLRRGRLSDRVVLLLAELAYLGWFLVMFNEVTHSRDAQAAIGLVVIGFCAFPVLLPVWIWLWWRGRLP